MAKICKKRFIQGLLICWAAILTVLVPVLPTKASEANRQTGTTIYVGTVQNVSGSRGTATNPYNDLRHVLENVAKDGDTIQLVSGGAFVNDIGNNDYPLNITKAITIRGNSLALNDALSLRSGGIVLSADVTFENIRIEFANGNHVGIFANGHKLTLNNVYCYNNSSGETYKPHIYGGGVTTTLDAYGTVVQGTPGVHGQIIISGSSGYLHHIYAGGENQNFSGRVTITINGTLSRIGEVYAYGKDGSTVAGSVEVNLNNSNISAVHGTANTEVSFTSVYSRRTSFSSIKSLTVLDGELQPAQLNETAAVTLGGGALNITTLTQSTKSFRLAELHGSGGALVMGRDDKLTVVNKATGGVNVKLGSYGWPTWANDSQIYIDLTSVSEDTAVFRFPDEEAYAALVKEGKVWKAEEKELISIEGAKVEFSVAPGVYNGELQEISATVTLDGKELEEEVDYYLDYDYDSLINAGSYLVKVVGYWDYTGEIERYVKVEKAESPAAEEQIIRHRAGEAGTFTAQLEAVLPKDRGNTYYYCSTLATDPKKILAGTQNVDVSTGVVSYELAGKTAYEEGMEAIIPITVVMDNYENLIINCRICLMDKADQEELQLKAQESVVFGKTLTLSTTGGSSNGTISYAVENLDGRARIEKNKLIPEKAGQVKVTATMAADSVYKEVNSTPVTITITPATPTVSLKFSPIKEEGKTLAEVMLENGADSKGTFNWLDADSTPIELSRLETMEVEENAVYHWRFTPQDAVNYTTVTGTVVLWKYDSTDWRGNLQSYYQQQQQERRESRQEHYRKWREHMNLNPSPW